MYVNIVSRIISTMVGGQAVQESFIIIETLPIWTQEVELSWEEKSRQSLINITRNTVDTEHAPLLAQSIYKYKIHCNHHAYNSAVYSIVSATF